MNLNLVSWKPFKIGSIFKMLNGKGITQEEILENEGDFIAVQSGEENNGVIGKIDFAYCKKKKYTYTLKPCLTVARTGSAGFVSFQSNGCVVGDSAKILLLDDEIASVEIYLFLQTILIKNRYKYDYGRKVSEEKYLNDWIKLPIRYNSNNIPYIDEECKYSNEGFIPDWQFMEDYIKSLKYKPVSTKNKKENFPKLKVEQWGEFFLKELFNSLIKGKCSNSSDLVDGNEINYVGAKYNGNGVMKSCSLIENIDLVSKGNCIAMIGQGEGSAGYAIYIDEDFIGATSLNLGYADWINKYTALFVSTILCQEYDKYSFGRSWTGDRLKNTLIKLPIDKNGSPDWQFMENYIRSLPYGDRI